MLKLDLYHLHLHTFGGYIVFLYQRGAWVKTMNNGSGKMHDLVLKGARFTFTIIPLAKSQTCGHIQLQMGL